MNDAKKSTVPGLVMLGSSMGMGTAPELHPDVWRDQEKFLMPNLTVLNNFCFMKYALKSVPGLADVGVLHGVGDGPRTPPRCLEGGQEKSFKCLVLLCITESLQLNLL